MPTMSGYSHSTPQVRICTYMKKCYCPLCRAILIQHIRRTPVTFSNQLLPTMSGYSHSTILLDGYNEDEDVIAHYVGLFSFNPRASEPLFYAASGAGLRRKIIFLLFFLFHLLKSPSNPVYMPCGAKSRCVYNKKCPKENTNIIILY